MLSSSLSTSVAGNITVFTLLKATYVKKQQEGTEWLWRLLGEISSKLLPAACKVKERAPSALCLDLLKRHSWQIMAPRLTTGGLVSAFHREGEKLSCETALHHSIGKQGLSSSGKSYVEAMKPATADLRGRSWLPL